MSATLNEEESEVMNTLLKAYKEILKWGLTYNTDELTAAVHNIQLFIIHHMLERENPKYWGKWFDPNNRIEI